MKRILIVPLLALCLGVACSDDPEPGVAMTADHSFDPESINVAPNEEIMFTNDSDESHTVTGYEADSQSQGGRYFASGGLESEEEARANVADGLIQPSEEFSVTLDEPGTYRYFCIPHEGDGMIGTIVVEE